MRVICILLSSSSAPKTLAEACLRLSPQVALGEHWIFLEISGCRHLYSETSCFLRLQTILKRLGLTARIAAAEDPATALAKAFYPQDRNLPIEALIFYANPFRKTSELDKSISLLKQLGMKTISQLKQISPTTLTPRFGKELAVALHHLEHTLFLPWPRFHLPERILETLCLDDTDLQDLEPVLFLLKNLVDKISLRLKGRWLKASVIEIKISTEKYSTVKKPFRTWRLNFAFPQGGTLEILSLLREHLNGALTREPLESPLRQIELEVLEYVPSAAQQKNLLSDKEEEMEKTQNLISRLVDRLGIGSVFLASPIESFLPERSWKKTLQTFIKEPDLFSAIAKRPLRLLKHPIHLKRVDQCLFSMHRRWRILAQSEPERISGEWWHKDQERDYFCIQTETEELWVYKIPTTSDYFLHGIFD